MDTDALVFLFFFFAFCGWVAECIMESLVRQRPVNKGFFKGPWVPVHGIGALAVYGAAVPLKHSPLLVFSAGVIFCTLLEYAAALVLERGFNVKCWDYETYPFTRWCHYKKRIAFTTSVVFGLMTVGVVYVLWDAAQRLMIFLGPAAVRGIAFAFSVLFVIDALVTGRKYLRYKREGISVKHSNDFSDTPVYNK
ncbi:MAG: putative ABC transporter permease [Treponema sp.]|jgi:uncharacterized membrane protein|nr:putative ABC transporter permease [Treponema sp.]